jgi:hypothetical protein
MDFIGATDSVNKISVLHYMIGRTCYFIAQIMQTPTSFYRGQLKYQNLGQNLGFRRRARTHQHKHRTTK